MKTDNEVIAEWMGYNWQDSKWQVERPGMYIPMTVELLEHYQKSWNWLMPVVEKIIQHKYWEEDDINREETAFLRTFGMKDEEGKFMVRFNRCPVFAGNTLLEATYLAVLNFIKNKELCGNTQ